MESYNTFLLLLIALTILWLVWVPLVNYGRKRKPPAQPERKFKTYGHAYPPLPALRDLLPNPPSNHAWELRVVDGGARGPRLRLSLLDLRTGQPVDSYESDLAYCASHATTWRQRYQGFKTKEFIDATFALFADPFVRWADTMTVRYETGDGEEYLLKGPK